MIKEFLNKLSAKEAEPQPVLETGTRDKILDSLRREEIRFQESEEKEQLKERLRLRKKRLLRNGVFGIQGDVEDEIDINNPKVNVNKTSVDVMKQKNLMSQQNLFKQNNSLLRQNNNFLKQKNLMKGNNKLKSKSIKFL